MFSGGITNLNIGAWQQKKSKVINRMPEISTKIPFVRDSYPECGSSFRRFSFNNAIMKIMFIIQE